MKRHETFDALLQIARALPEASLSVLLTEAQRLQAWPLEERLPPPALEPISIPIEENPV